jgi:hypothetical protein
MYNEVMIVPEALLPANALAVAKVAEASERQHLVRMAGLLERRLP